MQMIKPLTAAVVAANVLLSAGLAQAAATPEEIAKLGKELTCVGAEKAGNADGSITEWTGKWLGWPEHMEPAEVGAHPRNPYPDDKPLFVITAANMAEHAERLTAGQKALFETYPDTFRIPVYETRRDFRFADTVCQAALENAKSARVVSEGEGLEGTTGGIYFPFPKTGLELMWTSSFPYRAWTEEYISDNAYVLGNGRITWGKVHSRNLAPPLEPGKIGKTEGPSVYYRNETLLPQRDRGEINTGVEFFDNIKEPRQSWRYDPGTRRVRQSPEYGFDMQFPGTGGSITVDEVRIFNGSGKRYNWTIVGKQETYVPANAYAIHSPDVKYDELLTPGHVSPDHMRYELRRTWVLEASIKDNYRHLYTKRRIYIDEDSWQMVLADNYDARGGLWRTTMINTYYAPEMQTWQAGVGLYHDLQARTYLAFNLINELDKGYILNRGDLSSRDFGPEAARRAGR